MHDAGPVLSDGDWCDGPVAQSHTHAPVRGDADDDDGPWRAVTATEMVAAASATSSVP